ncbi:MAG TPA: hypothetical protein VGH74_20285 [Planctomycetaceae bacterium]
MIRWLFLFAAVVNVATFPELSLAADRRGQPSAEFDVAPDGDFLLLPVIINQHEYPFLVSTGIVTTVIDNGLKKKLELTKLESKASAGRGGQGRDRFGGLHAALGNIPLEFPDGVEAANFDTMRDKLDLECFGEIGMDVLKRFVVQIDFDEGKMRLLSAVPAGSGESLKITPMGAEGGAPLISVTFPGMPPEKFIVHTARVANSLELTSELFSRLEEKEKLAVLDKEKGVTRSAGVSFQAARLQSVQIGKSRHDDLIVNTGEHNVVCLAYLARYVVTLDFPRNRMYWKHGQHYDDRDSRLILADVEIERDKEAVTIRDVHLYGPAARLGLRRGDVLETLNSHEARRFSNWHIRRVLARDQGPLSAVVRRGSEKVTLRAEPTVDKDSK